MRASLVSQNVPTASISPRGKGVAQQPEPPALVALAQVALAQVGRRTHHYTERPRLARKSADSRYIPAY